MRIRPNCDIRFWLLKFEISKFKYIRLSLLLTLQKRSNIFRSLIALEWKENYISNYQENWIFSKRTYKNLRIRASRTNLEPKLVFSYCRICNQPNRCSFKVIQLLRPWITSNNCIMKMVEIKMNFKFTTI